MKKIIRLTEQDLHNIVLESVSRLLNESIRGKYQVYTDGELRNVYIDSRVPIIKVDDYTIEGEDAINGIKQIKAFLRYNNNGIESAIEQYLYDALR